MPKLAKVASKHKTIPAGLLALALLGCSTPIRGAATASGHPGMVASKRVFPTNKNLAPGPVARPIASNLTQRVVVINYHDIIPRRDQNSLWFDCSVSEFKNQLQTLKAAGCHFISVADLYGYLTGSSKLPTRAVAITFADGYEGFYKYGAPILRQMKIPAAEFVHTGFVGSPVGRPKMTWTQLKELTSEGFSIESQTVSHPLDLRQVTGAALDREMSASKAKLESELGIPCPYLAYPNGKFDENSEAAAKKAAYLMAFSEHQAPANLSPSIFAVNRYVHTQWRKALHDLIGSPRAQTHPTHHR